MRSCHMDTYIGSFKHCATNDFTFRLPHTVTLTLQKPADAYKRILKGGCRWRHERRDCRRYETKICIAFAAFKCQAGVRKKKKVSAAAAARVDSHDRSEIVTYLRRGCVIHKGTGKLAELGKILLKCI